ncbi:hypothetical protein VEE06_10640 [Escherichia coli]|nr:hypothetical protein VEE06_10640 [Escherichia coli]
MAGRALRARIKVLIYFNGLSALQSCVRLWGMALILLLLKPLTSGVGIHRRYSFLWWPGTVNTSESETIHESG